MGNLFNLNNLVCEYPNTNLKVLEVVELQIPKNEIVVILGLSGIGKTTILETLALMNNTIKPNTETTFNFHATSNGNSIDFKKLWKENNDQNISNIRNRHFSFIFQDANFMPSFTALENMYLTLLLQGESQKGAEAKVKPYLEELGLTEVINENKKIYELSGGQKQRIAYIRAIAPYFTVLFGDEPTGNLDIFSAHKLMRSIKANIKETERTAIIVSHDIDLSLKYADRLIIINSRFEIINNKKRRYGFIDDSSVYIKTVSINDDCWVNGSCSYSSPEIKSKIEKNLNI